MRTVVLLILDGIGVAAPHPGNAVSEAHTPAFQRLEREHFSLALQASGVAVGLPWGEPGNSEVGHLTIGAGRTLYHHLPRIIFAIRDGSFFTNPALWGAVRHAKERKSTLHLLGLLSSGSVHTYIDHFYALLELALREGLSREQVAIHMITDGRDATPQEAASLLPQIQERLTFLGIGRIASLMGRFFAMDRDSHWDRIQRAFSLLTEGFGARTDNPLAHLTSSYAQGITDEFIEPTIVVDQNGHPFATIQDHDAVIFFNFREDSARQLTMAFMDEPFTEFERRLPQDLWFATMTRYSTDLKAHAAFDPPDVDESLGEVIAKADIPQLRIAETEKYAHVTYFFNCSREIPFHRETRIIVPSSDKPNFELYPEMRADEIANAVIQGLEASLYGLIVANFANGDMLGHTGDFTATVRAVEAVDLHVGRILDAVLRRDEETVLIVTADHGNAEEKIDAASGVALTEHSVNPVPFYAAGNAAAALAVKSHTLPLWRQHPEGVLADVAPTILTLLGLKVPQQMTGKNLLR